MAEPTPSIDDWGCPIPIDHRDRIVMGHGGGGRMTARLLDEVFLPAFDDPLLAQAGDATVVDVGSERLAITTDAFVVQPLEFPGGDIGSLAVHGTVNDLTCVGAEPLYLTAAFVIEEGTEVAVLRRTAASMAAAAAESGVRVVAGDTKVVERGRGDGLHITTTGVGRLRRGVEVGPRRAVSGDALLLSGSIGHHGVAVMTARHGLGLSSRIVSDSAPVHSIARALFDAEGDVHTMRDPTRGGVAAALNEIAAVAGVGMVVDEVAVPVVDEVRSACALLGLDPLQVANEGRLLVIVAEADAARALDAMRSTAVGSGAVRIGRVTADHPGLVVGRTAFGGERIIDLPVGELLPRIC